ncbi:hypothetical protein G6F70_005864 [Rhizopus microsporus]|uniref:Peroxisomal membrane protein PEX14 n=1 Tax=Rhizopus azygosporus TaxID=86630 RepID=A0A367KCU5_RHIAZ|nr:hypothetical protein G6F71_005509 [Rhizopus microsporus]RCH99641.1 peroxisomal membrane protein pex14 [Rhizopus azygosporus]KAG1198347.1 hypothetical protein G6F70_005864 [Rhizopus microsporus]KAG1210165.1 hypothetical protein G6F69_005709 [Rhizopus microsporus]KAG1232146.1 hypothetical protein G6F67_005221 [Rhizopus microsporus]
MSDSNQAPSEQTKPEQTSTITLREDMLKPAVSFLTSPNVQSADKAKKIAFLQKKGLTQAEIDEAFKRAGDNNTHSLSTTTSANNNATNTIASRPMVPPRTQAPQIIYQPLPPTPSMPAEKVFALAVVLGMSAFGLTAAVIGILKKFIQPIFHRIADYKRTRYNQRRELADKLLDALKKHDSENDDLDAVIDQGDEPTLTDALIKHQADLQTKLQQLAQTAKSRLLKRTLGLDLDLVGFKLALSPSDIIRSDSPVSGLKSDIRSLKAALLNRRNFPIA